MFQEKKDAYLQLTGGNFLGAYYSFVRLAAQYPRDTDVATYLGMGIANIISILNPEVVVLGGGLFQAADLFLEPVRREFKRWAQPLAARSVRIELSTLGENAALYGCARLAWERS